MEKRKTPRVLIALEVTYDTGEEFLTSFLSDVSGGGVFIGTPVPLGSGTRLYVCFHIPGISDSILVTGTVVWARDLESSHKPGMGVRFDEMEPADRKRLDDFLAEQREV